MPNERLHMSRETGMNEKETEAETKRRQNARPTVL